MPIEPLFECLLKYICAGIARIAYIKADVLPHTVCGTGAPNPV